MAHSKENIFSPGKDLFLYIVFALLFFILVLLILTAWITDDAFITLRTADNFINGYGLTWNIAERVPTYTHPLWMFLLSFLYFFTREGYFTTIFFSIIISFAAIQVIVFKISANIKNSILVLAALLFSKAFIDYSTSGLENPLSYFLVGLFFYNYFFGNEDKKNVLRLSFITALAALNRFDLLILLLPALLFKSYRANKFHSIKYLIIGLTPLLLWILFSLFYYGFPFPNTAYAKLNHGIDSIELIKQGFYYLVNSFSLDPLTMPVIICGIIIPFILRQSRLYIVSIGIVLYLLYIIKIGGDFMSGRFLSVPFLVSIVILTQVKLSKKVFIVAAVSIIILGLFAPYPNILTGKNFGLGPKIVNAFRVGSPLLVTYDNGIADERLFYYQFTGLLNHKKLEEHQWVKSAMKIKEEKQTPIVYTIAGIFGYYAGPDIHIVDPWALCDPLLSKLPATEYWRVGSEQQPGDKWWRIGHFTRKIPDGYIETLRTGENNIDDESLMKYYDKLSFIIKGNLFDMERWIEIINFNLGKYDYLLEEYKKKFLNDG